MVETAKTTAVADKTQAAAELAHDKASFKYRYIYPRYLRTTTLVSDHIDVRKWFAGLGDPKGIGNSDRDNRELHSAQNDETPKDFLLFHHVAIPDDPHLPNL